MTPEQITAVQESFAKVMQISEAYDLSAAAE